MPGEKQHEASPYRREKAREEGRVSKSQDLAAALILMLGLLLIFMIGKGMVRFFAGLTERQLTCASGMQGTAADALAEWHLIISSLASHLVPLMGLLAAGAVLFHFGQTGPMLTWSRLAPDISRLNIIKGIGKLFSMQNIMRLLFGIFKIAVIATVAALSLYAHRYRILDMSNMSLLAGAVYLVELLLWTALKIAAALLVLAILDFAWQRWKHEQDLRMTTQEMHDELKQLQGDPLVRAQRKAVQRQLAQERLDQAVPKADAVITNPTELAVAIQYDPETMAAPIVVAKGAGLIAKRIRQLALEHGIPVLERKPLARALFRDVEVSHPIPEDKYAAVAEVLAYVYHLQGKERPAPPSAA